MKNPLNGGNSESDDGVFDLGYVVGYTTPLKIPLSQGLHKRGEPTEYKLYHSHQIDPYSSNSPIFLIKKSFFPQKFEVHM